MPALVALLLGAAVGQVDPYARSSAPDPPPCAAANVPGCLPGYKARIDRYGRLVYARDPDYGAPAPKPAARPSPPYSQPASWAYPATGVPRPAPEPVLSVTLVVSAEPSAVASPLGSEAPPDQVVETRLLLARWLSLRSTSATKRAT